MRRDYANAEAAARDALQVAPSYADGYGLLAFIKNALGQPQAAIELIERGMRLNPYYTWDYPYNLGRAYYMLGRIGEAIKVLEDSRHSPCCAVWQLNDGHRSSWTKGGRGRNNAYPVSP